MCRSVSGHAEAHDGAALDLVRQALRVQHGAAVGDADVVQDLELAGLDVELDLDEAGRERRHRARARQVVLRDADEARAGHAGRRAFVMTFKSLAHLVAVELAAELDRALRGLRVRQAFARDRSSRTRARRRCRSRPARRPNPCAAISLSFATASIAAGVVRARHRERRVAAELPEIPRQVLAAVAAHDDAVVPVRLQHLGRDARRHRVRIRAEVADAGMNVDLAVRRDAHEAVEAVAAGRVKRRADADAAHLRAARLAAARLPLAPN